MDGLDTKIDSHCGNFHPVSVVIDPVESTPMLKENICGAVPCVLCAAFRALIDIIQYYNLGAHRYMTHNL